MNDYVLNNTSNQSAAAGPFTSQMEHELTTRTSSLHGSNHTSHKLPEDVEYGEWFKIVRGFYSSKGIDAKDFLAYYNNDRDALTCPYHLLGVPGPNAEHGVEVIW